MKIKKDNYDISRLFITYLAFSGDTTKVSVATRIRPEVIEVLATMEDWPAKLEVYQTLRHDERQPNGELALCKVAAFITAHHLRDLIRRLLARLHSIADVDDLMKALSEYDPRTNRLKLRARAIYELTRAYSLAEKIVAREIRSARGDPADRLETDEFETEESRTLREAVWRALDAADHLPGVDAVAVMRDSVAVVWDANDEKGGAS